MVAYESKYAIGDTVALDGKLEHGVIRSVLFEHDATCQADYVIGYIVRFPGGSRTCPEATLRRGGQLLRQYQCAIQKTQQAIDLAEGKIPEVHDLVHEGNL